jgi:hypothetical protein
MGRRATIKAHPTTLPRPRPYGTVGVEGNRDEGDPRVPTHRPRRPRPYGKGDGAAGKVGWCDGKEMGRDGEGRDGYFRGGMESQRN